MASPVSDSKIYKYHVANLRSLEIALQNTSLSARKSISEENNPATASFVRLFAFLIGAWTENRLKKLLFEDTGFGGQDRERVLNQGTQLEQWTKAVELAFRKHYKVPKAPLSEATLTFTSNARYLSLIGLLDKDLRLIIEVRNKLAHGQWIYPFNSNGDGIEQEKYKLLNLENLPSLQYKFSLISNLADIVQDLVVSVPTFERDFDIHFKQISNTKNNLKNRKYENYEKMLIDKRKRGIQKRKINKA